MDWMLPYINSECQANSLELKQLLVRLSFHPFVQLWVHLPGDLGGAEVLPMPMAGAEKLAVSGS
jgi:hypothetical protein